MAYSSQSKGKENLSETYQNNFEHATENIAEEMASRHVVLLLKSCIKLGQNSN